MQSNEVKEYVKIVILSFYCYSVQLLIQELTLKSHGVRMRRGGIRSGGGGDDWLS